jgi:hypothetical protein
MFYKLGALYALQKLGWFGTYYHGTSPEAERAILGGEGLRASKAGTGWGESMKSLFTPQGQKLVQGRDAGRVYLSRSKLFAKGYGALGELRNPETLRTLIDKTKGSPPQVLQEVGKRLLEHQPLQVQGKGLPVRQGLGIPGVEVYTKGDIPVERISKAKPSRVGKALRALLRLRS